MNALFYGITYIAIPAIILVTSAQPQTIPTPQPATEAVEQPEDPLSTQPAEEPETTSEPPQEPACETQRACNEQIVRVFTIAEWGEHEWPSMKQLVAKESGFNNHAQNKKSTAYGMFQFLNSTWKGTDYEKTSDPITQTQAGIEYVKRRYGTPTKALQFHQQHNWY